MLDAFEKDPKMRMEELSGEDFFSCVENHVLSFIWQLIVRFDRKSRP